jgi:hypothetical protein
MADQDKLTVKESLNAVTSGHWTVATALTVTTTEQRKLLNQLTRKVKIQTSQDLYFTFCTTDANAINTSNDFMLTGGGGDIFDIQVPIGLGNTIYLALKASSASAAVKIVEW